MSFLYRFIAIIGILDKWAEKALKSYKEFKENEEQKRLEQASIQASKQGSISRLRDRNNSDNR